MALSIQGHIENWLIDDERFFDRLAYGYFKAHGSTASKSAIKDAVATLKGQAEYEGELRETSLRTAYHRGKYYLALCDSNWTTVEISESGWKLITDSPVAFYRSPVSLPLPQPKSEAKLDLLWELINVPKEDRLLVATFLIDCLRSNTNYPMLVLEGEQGSAKSTTQRYLKALIDPSVMILRVPPRKIQDVFVATANDHLLSFNNLSHLQAELQDALCCFSTGGTYAQRALYTNTQESVTSVLCPIILNGIGGLITRQDLMERCIYLDLPRIVEGCRRTDTELDELFETHRPELLGALLDLMVGALSALPRVSLANLPRMADFCLLGRAVAIAMGMQPNEFDRAYARNQLAGLERGLEALVIYPALLSFLEERPLGFSGSIKQLLDHLAKFRDDSTKEWPQNPRSFSTMLKRQAPALNKVGVEIVFDKTRKQDGYHLFIHRREDNVQNVHAVA
jgi:hypothetical protein